MTEQRQEDRALADACIEGSRAAWAALFEEHTLGVRYAVARTLRSYGAELQQDVIEDLESQLFLGLMTDDARRMRQYRAEASLAGWLRVRATRLAIDHLRRRRNNVALAGADTDEQRGGVELEDMSPSPMQQLAQTELIARLRAYWGTLDGADAEFAKLYFVEERSFEEIAELTGTSAGALYARKNRLRRRVITLADAEGWAQRSA